MRLKNGSGVMVNTEAGQRHREREAKRSREQSQSAREIAPLPPIKHPQRRIAARKDLKYFCEQYFPAKFKLAWSSYHLQVIDRLQEILVQGGGKLALAMPRGSGKSSLAVTAIVWAILCGYCRYIVLIGANKAEARKLIDSIKATLLTTKPLLDDFPEVIYPILQLKGSALLARGQLYLGELTNIEWKPDMVVFPTIPGSAASGGVIVSVGIKGAIRGKNRDMPDGEVARPDVIVLDDPQTDEQAKNPEQVKKNEEIINSTIEGLVGPAEELAMVMTCTVIQEGDLADRYLNHKLYPQWRGLRFKMIETMPERMDLWEKYKDIRREDPVAATMHYKRNRSEMQKGAVVAWEANYTSKELDALQYAMNKWSDNYESFMSEYQNEPFVDRDDSVVVPANVIMTRINGLKRRTVPAKTYKISAFLDVHDDLLYYCVTAWTDDFTGAVIDYGTFPEQVRKEFVKRDSGLITMKREFGGKKERYVALGIEVFITNLLAREYPLSGDDAGGNDAGSEMLKIDKLLIDSGYMPDVIQSVLQKIGQQTLVRPSYGKGIGAKTSPMSEWKKKPGELLHLGHFWSENRSESRKYRRVKVDTNYWKNYVHSAFDLTLAETGSLSLWGKDTERHRMFAEHVTAESVQLVEVGSRKVHEWTQKPGQDNHLFDCIVGCAVGASVLGIKTAMEKRKPQGASAEIKNE